MKNSVENFSTIEKILSSVDFNLGTNFFWDEHPPDVTKALQYVHHNCKTNLAFETGAVEQALVIRLKVTINHLPNPLISPSIH